MAEQGQASQQMQQPQQQPPPRPMAVTEEESTRSLLIENIASMDEELTEASLVQLCGAYGEISKLLLQNDNAASSRCIVVYRTVESARLAQQLHGSDMFGSELQVTLVTDLPQPEEGSLEYEVSDNPAAAPTQYSSAELVGHCLARGWVDGKKGLTAVHEYDKNNLGIGRRIMYFAGGVQQKWTELDERHQILTKMGSAYNSMGQKIIEVDDQYKIGEKVSATVQSVGLKAKQLSTRAMENPTVNSTVTKAGGFFSKAVSGIESWGNQALSKTKQDLAKEEGSSGGGGGGGGGGNQQQGGVPSSTSGAAAALPPPPPAAQGSSGTGGGGGGEGGGGEKEKYNLHGS